MKVLLQDRTTRLYLSEGNGWTDDFGVARDFGSSLSAMAFIQRFNLDQLDIVLKFHDPKYDIILPMKQEQDGAQPPRLP